MLEVGDAKKSCDEVHWSIAYINHNHIKDVRCEEDLQRGHLAPVLCEVVCHVAGSYASKAIRIYVGN